MVCRIFVAEKVTVPGNSRKWVDVQVPCTKFITGPIYVESSFQLVEEKNVCLLPGVANPKCGKMSVLVANFNNCAVDLYQNTQLGTGETYTDNMRAEGRCARVTVATDKMPHFQLPEYLREMWERSSTHLTPDESEKVAKLFIEYQRVFSKSVEDIGQTHVVQHKIFTGDAKPIKQMPRRLPFGKREIEKQEVQKMLQRGIIEPSQSAWSSPVVLVTKRDGSVRFCVDYRKLNECTIKDAYPLPRVDECLDALRNSRWFNVMDLSAGFWQIPMDPGHKHKTAFTTGMGLYQFLVMPFGLVNSPSTLERALEDILRGIQWVECLLYMDDIIVHGASVDICIERLEHVFQRLLDANLKLKPTKCSFFQKTVKFLGHIVSEEGVTTDPEKISAVKNWPAPRNAKEMRSFLGLCSYYRKFVKGFAQIARPLHKICEKGAKFVWDLTCEEAFTVLKEALTTAPVLSYPNPDKPFILDTDASDKALGAVLSQQIGGTEKVIAYMSKSLNKHEQSYCVTRKELLAVVTALRNFHTYLYGQNVLLRTDNAAVSWMYNLKHPTGQVARWLQELCLYNLTVTHRSGLKHRNADALSRIPCKACQRQENVDCNSDDEYEEPRYKIKFQDFSGGINTETELNTDCDIPQVKVITRGQARQESDTFKPTFGLLEGWEPADIRQLQLEDPSIGPILLAREESLERPLWNKISHSSSHQKCLWRQWDRLKIHGGMLYRTWHNEETDEEILHLIIPKCRTDEVLKYLHDSPSGGHLGVDKTLEKVKQSFYWPGMKEFVQKYCKECDKCTARKTPKESPAPMGIYIVGEPMEKIAIDILGPLPTTETGNKYLLMVHDCFTKWIEAYPLPNQEAETVSSALVNEFIC